MRVSPLFILGGTCLTASTLVVAHGDHGQGKPNSMEHENDWGSKHMLGEHHIENFDPGAFFNLHDFDENRQWTSNEILRTYGINPETSRLVDDTGHDDESAKGQVAEETKKKVLGDIMGLMDSNKDGSISLDEFIAYYREGGRLPDFKLGPGHHGDDEYEYELHHYEKYHDENTKEEDLNHPEDIAHFKKHDQDHHYQEVFEQQEKLKIVEANIPSKFKAQ